MWCVLHGRQGLNWVGSRQIPDPASWDLAPLFGDLAPKLGDLLEFFSAMSLLVIIAHHDSYKYVVKNFPFQRVAVVGFW